ncbi:SMI1/KNR4 family protein [Pseudobacteroides cellulosolvens]|uniref:Cell wall assembly/cell proliferation coordinating protein, KNR4-like protein n=1 Tax=Pseudobacteroides cellulosolvens ATCC 35603 = DSM 2933 TaxID=398512 RepID=A0A0L6JJJ1_9FIRM|nr:SMI1/KNR4 family protein [Pseudobacteroides cellulosolvens]KNY25924.1 Cell wall assembly/cell proliferation coordinating protein, KNR4-like protein [Pseudobacteroides cellulosolvens ATCC 35603 = DSM 2933]
MDLSKIDSCCKNEPAKLSEIEKVEAEAKIILPEIYKELLLQANGIYTNETIVIYGTNEILERYQTLQVEKYSSGYICIGDNSRPDVFLMKQDRNAYEVLITDCGYMNAQDPNGKILNFKNWVEEGCLDETESKEYMDMIGNRDSSVSYIEPYNVILVSTPKNGSRDLLVLKKVFDLEISIGDLLRGSKQLPFTIIRNITYAKALNRIEKLGELGEVIKLVPSSDE